MEILNSEKEIQTVLNLFKLTLPSLREGRIQIDVFSKKIYENGYLCVFRENGADKGFGAFYANDTQNKIAYLTMIAVREEYRREKIGGKILNFIENFAKEKNMRFLKLEVAKSNEGAIKFYNNQGFDVCEKKENSYYMIKNLV